MDAEGMCDCYSDDVLFSDPAFGQLKGVRAKNMWRMLVDSQRGKDFKVEFNNIIVNEDRASAHWEAHYVFSKTGRKVHNKIEAQFELKDGKIHRHKDDFNLHNWATQTLGIKGWLIGWTDFFQKQLQKQTNRLLDKFEAKVSSEPQ